MFFMPEQMIFKPPSGREVAFSPENDGRRTRAREKLLTVRDFLP